MKSKGLPMHSPRSPIYGETLARCTRVVYLPRFLQTAAHRWASEFPWLWLGHMYIESKGLPIHSPISPVYGKTLARCTRAVYPTRFLWTTPDTSKTYLLSRTLLLLFLL
jgi:hypothetical protein